MFHYWGRRGPMAALALEIAQIAPQIDWFDTSLSIADACELAPEIVATGTPVQLIPGFDGAASFFCRTLVLPRLRRWLGGDLRRRGIDAVITLMPHVWSPLMPGLWRSVGVRRLVVVHDAAAHPGDPMAALTRWLLYDARSADAVVTFSHHVTRQLVADGRVPSKCVYTMPHPTLTAALANASICSRNVCGPVLRLLFFGRILRYKGLSILTTTAEILRALGVPFDLSVIGEGSLEGMQARLLQAGARVENRWVPQEEVAAILRQYDAIVLPYIEASQSGVIALARGVGLPVIASDVGGISEQVRHDVDGILVPPGDSQALADAIIRLASDTATLKRLADGSLAAAQQTTVKKFTEATARILLDQSNAC